MTRNAGGVSRPLRPRLPLAAGLVVSAVMATGALAAFEEALANDRRLAALDPSNTLWTSGVAASLPAIGWAEERRGALDEVAAAYGDALDAMAVSRSVDPGDVIWAERETLLRARPEAVTTRPGPGSAD